MMSRAGRSVRAVAVAAASRHGSTAEVADRIAARLTALTPSGWAVSRPCISDHAALSAADAVVMGSPVYLGEWLAPATAALHHVVARPDRPLWLFSVGPLDAAARAEGRHTGVGQMRIDGRTVDHQVFDGRIDSTALSLTERIVLRLVGLEPGDWRDWSAIDEWATHLASSISRRAALELEVPSRI